MSSALVHIFTWETRIYSGKYVSKQLKKNYVHSQGWGADVFIVLTHTHTHNWLIQTTMWVICYNWYHNKLSYLTAPKLPLTFTNSRFLNFPSWRPCWAITVAALRDEGWLHEAIWMKQYISHSRKAIFSYATLKSGGLCPLAAVALLGVCTCEQWVYCPWLQMICVIQILQ